MRPGEARASPGFLFPRPLLSDPSPVEFTPSRW
jgi:hypothetical protein